MSGRPLNVTEMRPPGDWPGLRARAAELLLEATDAAQAGRALFNLIAGDLKLNIFLLYVRGRDERLELIAHGGLSDAEAATAAALARFDGGAFIPPTGHSVGLQDVQDAGADFLRSIGLKAWFAQPLMAGERLIGIIGFGRFWASKFQEEELAFLERMARFLSLALEQLRGDAALRESEERLRLGMAVAGFKTFDYTVATGQVVASADALEDLGLPPDQPVSVEALREVQFPDDRDRILAARRASCDPEGTGIYDEQFRVIRPDGALRWSHVRSQTFFEGEGGARRPVRVIGVEQDITEAKLAEQRLQASEERLRLAVETAGFGVFEYDVERDEGVWSPEFRAIYGFAPDENIDLEKLSRRVHPDDRHLYLDPLFVTHEEGDFDDYSLEFRIFRPDGEMRWVVTKARQLFGPGSDYPKRVIGISQDITEQKLAAERLRESERRLQLAQELGGVASWEGDQANNEIWVSESFRRIFGVAPAAPLDGATFLALLHPDDLERVTRCFREIAEDAKSLEIEYRIIRSHDQKLRWIYSMSGVVRDPLTAKNRLSGIVMDITGRKRDEERERLLSREVDHRAKNLLSIVQAMVQLTQANSIPDFVDQVTGRIHALGRVHGLLAASRWDGAELANLIVDELAPFADSPDRSRLTGPSVGLKPGAAQSMALVIHELTTNAVKHGALASPRGRVDISWAINPAPDGQLVLHWCESGGATVEAPRRFGFGMTHIRASVERQLSGTIEMNWRAEGLQCVLTLPARQLAPPSH
jgi:PAS domain S-box-containing protein